MIEYRFLDYAIESTASFKNEKLRELNFTQMCYSFNTRVLKNI